MQLHGGIVIASLTCSHATRSHLLQLMPDMQSRLLLACMLHSVNHVLIIRDVALDPGRMHLKQCARQDGESSLCCEKDT